MTINNTKGDNKITIKLCVDNGKGKTTDNKNQKVNSSGLVVIGISQFNLSEI